MRAENFKLHSKLATANSAQDQVLNYSRKTRKKSRLDSLVSELNAMTGNLSIRLSQVKVAAVTWIRCINDEEAVGRGWTTVGGENN